MPDYVYLLENRLSPDQRHALTQLRSVAREASTILFLTGDAVRDLTSGHAVRELEIAIHGNALKLKKAIEKAGGKLWGEDEPSRSLYLCFPGTVRVDVISTHAVEYPKPGKPVYHFTSIQEDLRRRDFTVNAMAISLNEGSYGLLMDPLNGAADIESRILRLVSNYGFIEDPALLIRATRYRARLGWELDARTQTRYENAKGDGAIENLSQHGRSRELEQIGHEEDGLKVLRALDAEGWMKVLFPAWTPAKADEAKLSALHELGVALQGQGVHADMSAAQMELLTAKLAPKDLSALKRALQRPGFVAEWNNLESIANAFAKVLLSKANAKPSAGYKLFMSYDPEAVLWLGFTSKNKEVQERYNLFLKVWPEARQRIPYVLMQELRITPELPEFAKIREGIFLELIDGKLTTPEEMRAYLEPLAPPAPPPQVTIKRSRPRRGARVKEEEIEEEEAEESLAGEDDLDADEEELDLSVLPKSALAAHEDDGDEEESEEEEDLGGKKESAGKKGQKAAPAKAGGKPAPGAKAPVTPPKPPAPIETKKAAAPAQAAKPAEAKPAAAKTPVPAAKAPVPAAKAPVAAAKGKAAPAAAKIAKPAASKAAAKGKPAVKPPVKVSKPAAKKPAAKAAAKTVKRPAAKPSKPAPKKPAKPKKKR